jgi:hypothetical protein
MSAVSDTAGINPMRVDFLRRPIPKPEAEKANERGWTPQQAE